MKNNKKKSQASNMNTERKIKCHGDVQLINQAFQSVEISENTIKKTMKSIDETMKFIKELEEKEFLERKDISKS